MEGGTAEGVFWEVEQMRRTRAIRCPEPIRTGLEDRRKGRGDLAFLTLEGTDGESDDIERFSPEVVDVPADGLAKPHVSSDAGGQVAHRRPDIDIVSLAETNRAQAPDLDPPGSGQPEDEKIAPNVPDFPLEIGPGYLYELCLGRNREIAVPLDGDREDPQVIPGLEHGLAEG